MFQQAEILFGIMYKNNMKILISGSQGFLGSYLCNELLSHGHIVIGVDDFSRYGKIKRAHDSYPNFTLLEYTIWSSEDDLRSDIYELKPDIIVSMAALVGGVALAHKYPYKILSNNNSITQRTFDVAIDAFKDGFLKRIIIFSSSMVYENAVKFPCSESDVENIPPPHTTYGLQKLSGEYMAKGAYEQYGLPYTIIRPFNCVGIEDSGNNIFSHILPNIAQKILNGQDPLHIFGSGNQTRCYVHGKDLAKGVRLAIESDKAVNETFNISVSTPTTVLKLAEMVWNKINPEKPFRYISNEPFQYDVQKNVADTSKAKELLNFEAKITLEESIDEVIQYIKDKYDK